MNDKEFKREFKVIIDKKCNGEISYRIEANWQNGGGCFIKKSNMKKLIKLIWKSMSPYMRSHLEKDEFNLKCFPIDDINKNYI